MNYGKGFSVFAWGKLYRKELLEQHPYPIGRLYEDLATTYKIIGASNKIAVGNRVIYYWIQRKGSITRSDFNEAQMYGIVAARDQLDYITKYYPKAVSAGQTRYVSKVIELIAIGLQSKTSRDVYNIMRKKMVFTRKIMTDPNVKKTMKLRCVAVRLGYIPTKIVFGIHNFVKERLF